MRSTHRLRRPRHSQLPTRLMKRLQDPFVQHLIALVLITLLAVVIGCAVEASTTSWHLFWYGLLAM